MKLEINTSEVENKGGIWTTVTPFSKYLVLAMFVALPFIGGWVGYTFAPEKVVEVERIVVREVVKVEKVVDKGSSRKLYHFTTLINLKPQASSVYPAFNNLEVGMKFNDFTFIGFQVNGYGTDEALFVGNTKILGRMIAQVNVRDKYFEIQNSELSKIPIIGNLEDYGSFYGNRLNCIIADGLDSHSFYEKNILDWSDPNSRYISATTTIEISGLGILDPNNSGACLQTKFVGLIQK